MYFHLFIYFHLFLFLLGVGVGWIYSPAKQTIQSGIIQGMGSANEKQCYIVTPSLIGWANSAIEATLKNMGKSIHKQLGPLLLTWIKFNPSMHK